MMLSAHAVLNILFDQIKPHSLVFPLVIANPTIFD